MSLVVGACARDEVIDGWWLDGAFMTNRVEVGLFNLLLTFSRRMLFPGYEYGNEIDLIMN